MKRTALKTLPVLIALGACSTGATSNASYDGPLEIVTAAKVEHCNYVTDIQGSSSLYGMFSRTGTNNARDAVFKEAERIGATHLVWTGIENDNSGSYAYADAYVCD